MGDAETIAAFQSGDGAAFQILFERHAGHVYRTAYLIVLDRERAEDVAQETFLALFQRLPRLAAGPVGSWLDRVAANLSLNEHRKVREVSSDDRLQQLDRSPQSTGADFAAEDAEDRAAIWALLETLTPRQRAMVVMRFYGDLTFEEIAGALGCRSGTVRATVHQALQHLRRDMAPRRVALVD